MRREHFINIIIQQVFASVSSDFWDRMWAAVYDAFSTADSAELLSWHICEVC